MSNWKDRTFSQRRQDTEKFNESIHGDSLELAIEWISENLSVDDVFNDSKICDYIAYNGKNPSDFFGKEDLADWASENGYVKEE